MNTPSEPTYKEMKSKSEEICLEIKKDWNNLWTHKYDDEITAEGISTETFSKIDVDQGQVIYAPRGCKSMNLEDIIEKKLGSNFYEKINPHPEVGGWKTFAKNNLPRRESMRERPKIKVDLTQHQRKHGRGWLNQIRISSKIKKSR